MDVLLLRVFSRTIPTITTKPHICGYYISTIIAIIGIVNIND